MPELKENECWLEVVSGPAGNSIYISDNNGGYRLSGPKPWGGGQTIHKFKVNLDELIREANALKSE